MTEQTDAYDAILRRYVEWARERADVRAVLLVGSRARSDHPADRWADLDIISLTNRPGQYLDGTGWIDRFGEVWALTRSRTAGGDPEWLVCYAGGLDVDFVFGDSRKTAREVRVMDLLARFPVFRRVLPREKLARLDRGRAMGADTFARGMKILVDKDGLVKRLAGLLGEPPPYHLPGAEEFSGRVSNFWLMAVRIAKKIGRGELAVSLSWMSSLYWSALLPMIEWHAHATRGAQTDTWHAGRFLEEWADPRVAAALPEVFAPYDQAGARAALLASMALFRWVSQETADCLGYAYPAATDSRITAYVQSILPAGS
jgi:aminoglycoside 6-adenylyltransferase